jgi:hypothetical protein
MLVHKNSLRLIVKDSPLNPYGACPNARHPQPVNGPISSRR